MKVLRWSVKNVQIKNRLETVNQNRLVTVCGVVPLEPEKSLKIELVT